VIFINAKNKFRAILNCFLVLPPFLRALIIIHRSSIIRKELSSGFLMVSLYSSISVWISHGDILIRNVTGNEKTSTISGKGGTLQ